MLALLAAVAFIVGFLMEAFGRVWSAGDGTVSFLFIGLALLACHFVFDFPAVITRPKF